MRSGKNQRLIGVDLGGTNVRAGLIEQNKLVALEKNPTFGHADADVVVEEICKTIAAVFRPGITGIGVGVPIIVDVEKTNISRCWRRLRFVSTGNELCDKLTLTVHTGRTS